jgi:hypothetical protein
MPFFVICIQGSQRHPAFYFLFNQFSAGQRRNVIGFGNQQFIKSFGMANVM